MSIVGKSFKMPGEQYRIKSRYRFGFGAIITIVTFLAAAIGIILKAIGLWEGF